MQQRDDEMLSLPAAAVEDDRQLRARQRQAEMWQAAIPTLSNSPASCSHLLGPNRHKYRLQGNIHGREATEPEPEPDS